jgi:hypothetical protein
MPGSLRWGGQTPKSSRGPRRLSIRGISYMERSELMDPRGGERSPPPRSLKRRDLGLGILSVTCLHPAGPIQLWQFLLELLQDKARSSCIRWTGNSREFQLCNPKEVGQLLCPSRLSSLSPNPPTPRLRFNLVHSRCLVLGSAPSPARSRAGSSGVPTCGHPGPRPSRLSPAPSH